MKKVLFPLIALVLALGLAVPGAMPAGAHIESDPFTTDLLAGQTEDVGNVSVWNDDTNLYVQYVLDDPWVMTDSHLYVGKTNPASFPSTPGQFPYSPGMEKSPSPGASYDEANMTYTIPLGEIYEYVFVGKGQGKGLNPTGTPGVTPCVDDVYIAAHADVVQKIEACMDVVSNASVEWSADGTSWNHTVACYVHPNWINIIGATWIWRTEYTDVVWEYDNVPDGGWYFKKEFTIPGEPLSGEIAINADNTYNLSVNGVYVGKEGSMDKDGPDNHEWSTIDTFDLTNLNSGLNTIEVRALNFFRTGSSTGNPAGLAFIAEVCYEDIIAEETAWGNGTTFGTNWATYFGYHIQEPPCPFPLVGNTENIGLGLRVTGPVAYPNDTPVTFTGTVNASGLQSNGAVFIGLVDKDYVDGGNSGWMGGAYIYFGRGATSNNLRVGPTDGNFGGEIVQVFKTYTDYFLAPTNINFTMVIYNGNITVALNPTDYVDTYGEIKALNNKTAYAWDEFEYGAYIAVDTWPYGSSGVNDVSYDVLVDWCGE